MEPGLAYHVTQRGTNRQRVFFSAGDHRMYLGLLREQLEDSAVRVLAYCLMSNHVHLIVVPERADSLAVLFRRVHGRYAQYMNVRRHRSGHLWQQRYFSCALSERHLWVALKYVEQNPCRAGIARHAGDYRWSSAAAHMGIAKDKSGVLDWDFFERGGGAETWRQMHAAQDDAAQLELLRRCTYSGRPFGDTEFLEQIETRFQRSWRRYGFEKMAAGAGNS